MKYFTILFLIAFVSSCTSYDVKWTSIGDSITYVNNIEYKGQFVNGYQDFLIKSNPHLKIKLDNEGYSGLPLTGG